MDRGESCHEMRDMICESDFPRGARQAARVILIDPGDRVLFCRGVEPATGAVFWVMPGGGLEAGESYEDRDGLTVVCGSKTRRRGGRGEIRREAVLTV